MIKLVTGVVTFFYCIVPIIQFHIYDSSSDRFDSHYFFVFSMEPFAFMEFIYTNSIIPYISQLFIWLIYWYILYILFIRFFSNGREKE